MPKFFIRFNNNVDLDSDQVDSATLARLSGKDEEAVRAAMESIEADQTQRVKTLREEAGASLSGLKGLKTVFLGDSITKDHLGYRRAVTRAAELDARNLAVSGSYSTMLLHNACRYLKSLSPDLVSLMSGGNDSALLGEERLPCVSPSEYKRNISAFLRWSLEVGAKVLLFEVTPVHEARFKERYCQKNKYQTNENIAKYNAVLQELSQEFGIPLHSNQWLLEDPDTYFEPDGIHLSKEGHDLFAQKWLAAAIKII